MKKFNEIILCSFHVGFESFYLIFVISTSLLSWEYSEIGQNSSSGKYLKYSTEAAQVCDRKVNTSLKSFTSGAEELYLQVLLARIY